MKFKVNALLKKYKEFEEQAKKKHLLKKAELYHQFIIDLEYVNDNSKSSAPDGDNK